MGAGACAEFIDGAPPLLTPFALPPQVQGWHGARRRAVRGSPARASVVSPHYYRYVSTPLRSWPRELDVHSQCFFERRSSLAALCDHNTNIGLL